MRTARAGGDVRIEGVAGESRRVKRSRRPDLQAMQQIGLQVRGDRCRLMFVVYFVCGLAMQYGILIYYSRIGVVLCVAALAVGSSLLCS